MQTIKKPEQAPTNPNFSSGPCAKRPGWSNKVLSNALVGRSHRAKESLERIQQVLDLSKRVLGLPNQYRAAIVPASDTGSMELAMWSLLGAKGVDFFTWENFGEQWVIDGQSQLTSLDCNIYRAPYGQLPNMNSANPNRDCVFVWNGTTSGVRVPNADWISNNRTGLTICDATSAVFSHRLPWEKLDVVTYSWQKALGGEAGFGMLLLGPKAIKRLESFTPPWPIPKIFRIVKNNKLIEGIFRGETINTVSMLAIEDVLDALNWVDSIGGVDGMIQRAETNHRVVNNWVECTPWIDFLASNPEIRSRSTNCLTITDQWFMSLNEKVRWEVVDNIGQMLADEGVAFDIVTHRAASPGLRIWSGGTVESSDLEMLFPWIEWAWNQICVRHNK